MINIFLPVRTPRKHREGQFCVTLVVPVQGLDLLLFITVVDELLHVIFLDELIWVVLILFVVLIFIEHLVLFQVHKA